MELKKLMRLARKIAGGEEVNYRMYGLSREEYMSLKDAVKFLKSKFPNKSGSWITRAIIRALNTKELGNNKWMVKGVEELGDAYGYYRVTYFETSNKYTCTCYNTAYGYMRKRSICTHIAGVMLYRRWRNRITYYTTVKGKNLENHL